MQSFKLKFKEILLISALIFAFSSCKKSDDNQTTDTSNKTAPYESGVFIANQGGYGKGNGSISYYDRSGKVVSDVFQLVNNRPLGDIVQSMSIYNGKAYIVVNNSGKVEVADAGTFSSTGVIKNLTSPRYFVGISSSKGYISDWGSGTTGGNIKVVDLTSNTITKTIAAGKYPDKMILSGTKLFVINSAGLDKDSTITIIDTQTDTPLKTLVIGGDPTGIVTDSNGKIWVLCSGIEDYAAESNSTPGKIVRINPNDYSIEYSYTFPDNTKHPTELCTNSAKKRLFYIYGSGVSYYDITTSEIVPFITPANGYIYGLGYDPKTDYIYLTDPKDFNSNGTVYRYNSTTGALKDNFQVGINPQEITFN